MGQPGPIIIMVASLTAVNFSKSDLPLWGPVSLLIVESLTLKLHFPLFFFLQTHTSTLSWMETIDFCLFSDFQILKLLFPWLTAANWKFLKTTVRTALNLTAINQEMGQPGPIIVASLTAVNFSKSDLPLSGPVSLLIAASLTAVNF